VTSIVLAGGCSSRLGREKSQEILGGERLIGLVINRLSSLSDEILIVVSPRQLKSSFSSSSKVKTVVDIYPNNGSLGGIYTGLVYSTSFHNLVVACDMPFLNMELLRHMFQISPAFDVVMPKIGNRKEPLHAIYTKNCVHPMERLLHEGCLRIADFPDLVNVKYVEKDEIDVFDPEHLSFFNINTPTDLERARMLAEQKAHKESVTATSMRKTKDIISVDEAIEKVPS